MIWLMGICFEIGFTKDLMGIHYDPHNKIFFAKNSMYVERTKHIDIRLHFIKNIISQEEVKILVVHTYKYLAYMLTKVLHGCKFDERLSLLEVTCFRTHIKDEM